MSPHHSFLIFTKIYPVYIRIRALANTVYVQCAHACTTYVFVCLCVGVSEKCGQGSLVKLRQRIEKRDIGYSCYDVFGYPVNTDPTLVELTECAANIITAQQQSE